MRLPRAKRLRRAVRQARSRWKGCALVLGYHRVTDEPEDPYDITVRPDNFAEQLEVIRRLTGPTNLEDLVDSLARERVERGRVAITFDDGYSELLETAIPLLERYEIPATLFVVTGCLGQSFWWDELYRAVRAVELSGGKSPLRIAEATFQWKGEGRRDGRGALLDGLYRQLRKLPARERSRALEEVARWAGQPERPSGPRVLTAEELARLRESELVDVGSHTVTHPDMTDLTRSAALRELERSKADLEAMLGRPIMGFAYPFGSSSPALGTLVREAGYRFACTSREDTVGVGTDSFAIPRLWVPDLSGGDFSKWLGRWI